MSEDGRVDGMKESRLLKYLPDIYQGRDDVEFMRDFLGIFETIWGPLEQQIDHLYAYFDPRLTPAEFLPWLSTWVGLVLENIPEEWQRELLGKAVWLYQRRGTADALREHLRICLNLNPKVIDIQDRGNGIVAHTFRVTITIPISDDKEQLKQLADRIIQAEKPAHTNYELIIIP